MDNIMDNTETYFVLYDAEDKAFYQNTTPRLYRRPDNRLTTYYDALFTAQIQRANRFSSVSDAINTAEYFSEMSEDSFGDPEMLERMKRVIVRSVTVTHTLGGSVGGIA